MYRAIQGVVAKRRSRETLHQEALEPLESNKRPNDGSASASSFSVILPTHQDSQQEPLSHTVA